MKLTTRVSAYFLLTLAIALTIYSLVFYSVTRQHVESQFEHELRGVLNSFVAAAEIEETEVKWQPLEHSVSFGSLDEFGGVDWVVIGDKDRVVEKSRGAGKAMTSMAMELAAGNASHGDLLAPIEPNRQRRVLYHRLSAPNPVALNRELDEFDELIVVVGRSTAKRDLILSQLTLLVTLLPLVAWCVAAALGRWIVRQALRPVSAMAAQAQSIAGSDFQSRLVLQDSGDELAELGTTFNHLLDRQQAAFEQQRRFAGDAAHELRSPITVLLGQIDVTLRRTRSVDEYISTMERLRTQTHAFQEIVEALLFLARSEEETARPTMQSFHVASWLNAHAATWNGLPRAADLRLDNQIEHSIMVRGTSTLLARVLENLLSNAMKYSVSGSPIQVDATNNANHVIFRITDSGCGISATDQPHLFDPFFRSGEARRKGIAGNGLGLAIANRIATTLGGTLNVKSTLGRGSCFTLLLPIDVDGARSTANKIN
ncbi:Signal transduction histidine-protein kinase ArlS [Rosistilla carotiformis]|uniref:histidine kinase n=1 Tax=Rosistilla carotiformis TaxID=2528017 RepID=A0A518JT26_9BACT|nr:ATP-binding protein [Rosistilla carotiformis]QDV68685.1 Signal transduction histidine-protein kinase ArlS [Rosistilla carotiformis]